MQDLWQFDLTYVAACVACKHTLAIDAQTQDEAILHFIDAGWVAHEIGTWCDECVPELFARRGRKHSFALGDVVARGVSRHRLGPIVRIGTGWAGVQGADGYESIYTLAELVKFQ